MQTTAHQVQWSLCVRPPQWAAGAPGGDVGALYRFFKSLHTAEGSLCSFHSQISELMRCIHGNDETHCIRVRVRESVRRYMTSWLISIWYTLNRFNLKDLQCFTNPCFSWHFLYNFVLFKHIYWLLKMYCTMSNILYFTSYILQNVIQIHTYPNNKS